MARPASTRPAVRVYTLVPLILAATVAHSAWVVPCPVSITVEDPGPGSSIHRLELDVARVHARDCSNELSDRPGGLLDLADAGPHSLMMPDGEACWLGFELDGPVVLEATVDGALLAAEIQISYIWTKLPAPMTVEPGTTGALVQATLGQTDWLDALSLSGSGPWTIDSPSQPAYHQLKSALKALDVQ